ncbi:hypothetical protein TPHA_0B00810 [Tetrapisispora phaffii CBS 4417]|uniref:Elongator complex protein 1 n=1 Tax=Tetrapisispora phaffii (strain ATCC 24235 / CBS 4417 / NBRC 1672 / NRRL Y-8282 / UCD 70-5) TaxID=1071381 RepID=G8BQF6_TETPH|nr:hypothetical protein TPHA_0B00810 [Tetrapisispora phaffii CBS 4417]CCE61753.1 hypothetical protein TPHA_0B00810 [Tetrapisispora phaffii CBS 4417]
MRNLVTLNHGKFKPTSMDVEEFDVAMEVVDSVFDTLTDSITCVLVNSEIGKYEVQQFMKDGSKNVLVSSNFETYNDTLLSFVHFADINQLVFIFKGGDIISCTYDSTTFDPLLTVVEIVGSIDNGIEAAEWSSDEETLVLVTADSNVVVLSKLFEPISEVPLQVEDLKMSKHVNVGWGKKETQFRGAGAREMERQALESLKASGLVGNELRDPTMPYMVDSGIATNHDNGSVSISWRGDCEYFAVSRLQTVTDPDDETLTINRRVLRVYNRECVLDSVSEPVDGMEHNLSWKPQGSLIASIQRKTHLPGEESLDLIFFERNGLRHGEFDTRLPLDEDIIDICWNNNSEVLTIVMKNKIQLWTSKNYHWFLKQELYTNGVTYAKWHPEKDLTLMFGSEDFVNIVDFSYKMIQGSTFAPFDYGTTVVIDGTTVHITPLSIATVPPPIYFRDFETPDNVIDVAVNISSEVYAALNKDALVLASVNSIEEMRDGKHPDIRCILPKTEFANESDTLRQVAFINDSIVAVLFDSGNLSQISIIDIQDINNPYVLNTIEIFNKVLLLRSSFEYNSLVYQLRDGSIHKLDAEGQIEQIAQFPRIVCDFRVKRVHNSQQSSVNEWNSSSSELVAIGLTSNGKLYANDVQLSSSVTSMEITDTMLLFTSAHHHLQFIHLNSTEFKPVPIVEGLVVDERIRSIERGSIIVNVMPSKSSVVLQANRGNLETIYPRIMVLSEVRKDILAKKYKEAFVICRTHRINLDILHDYAPELFFDNIELFINEIKKVSYLDLFISCLLEEDVTETKYKETLNSDIDEAFKLAPAPLTEIQQYVNKKHFDPSKSKVNKICDALLNVFLNKPEYKKNNLQSILTAYASYKPQKLEEALTLISSLESPSEQDESITYLCFLQDVNLVYKVALSLYDVKLSLAVAQKSQMDPREYLPFLQTLHEADTIQCKFLIDDHLKNYEMALSHLIEGEKSESSVSETIISYVEDHNLYKHALALFRYDTSKQNYIYEIFAKFLSSQQDYTEAGIIFEMLERYEESLNAFISGKRWKEALSIVLSYFPERLNDIADDLISSLKFEHKYLDVAEIQLHFLNNVKDAMENYCKAYGYDIAMLLAIKNDRKDLIESVVDINLSEGFAVVAELLADCKGQVNSQLKRLRELRAKKEEDPYAFYGQETEQADDVSIAPSETSTKESFFTRYTGKTGGTAKTGASRRSSKNRRREERKRARGKKGTIYEEEYLVKSIGRLIERIDQTKPDAIKLIDALCRRNMREQAYQIQKNFSEVLALLKEHLVEIYTISEKDRERFDDNGVIYYLPEIPIPNIAEFPVNKVIDY